MKRNEIYYFDGFLFILAYTLLCLDFSSYSTHKTWKMIHRIKLLTLL